VRVFVTGASGWVGRALVPDLVAAGHHVVGLARSDSSADALVAAGGVAHPGSLDDLDSLREGAAKSDGVIHLAFNHDFTQYETANETDRRAIETIGAVGSESDDRLALERARAGSVWHAIAEEGVATRTIAEAIGRQLGIPTVPIPLEDAGNYFGWTGLLWSINAPTSSELTRQQLGWQPAGPGLIEDLEQGHYFRTP